MPYFPHDKLHKSFSSDLEIIICLTIRLTGKNSNDIDINHLHQYFNVVFFININMN